LDLANGSAAAALGFIFREADGELFPFVQALRDLNGRGDTKDERPPGWGVVPWKAIQDGVNRLAVRSGLCFETSATAELISVIIFARERAFLHQSAGDKSVSVVLPSAIERRYWIDAIELGLFACISAKPVCCLWVSERSLRRSGDLSGTGCVSLTFWAPCADTQIAMSKAMGLTSRYGMLRDISEATPGVLRRVHDIINPKPAWLIFQNNHFEPLHPQPVLKAPRPPLRNDTSEDAELGLGLGLGLVKGCCRSLIQVIF
jgi:hypothetical protein